MGIFVFLCESYPFHLLLLWRIGRIGKFLLNTTTVSPVLYITFSSFSPYTHFLFFPYFHLVFFRFFLVYTHTISTKILLYHLFLEFFHIFSKALLFSCFFAILIKTFLEGFMLYHRILEESQRIQKQILSTKEKLLSAPNGKLFCAKNGNHFKWYHSLDSKQIYIPKKNRACAEQLALKKYYSLLLEDLQQELTIFHFDMNVHLL